MNKIQINHSKNNSSAENYYRAKSLEKVRCKFVNQYSKLDHVFTYCTDYLKTELNYHFFESLRSIQSDIIIDKLDKAFNLIYSEYNIFIDKEIQHLNLDETWFDILTYSGDVSLKFYRCHCKLKQKFCDIIVQTSVEYLERQTDKIKSGYYHLYSED